MCMSPYFGTPRHLPCLALLVALWVIQVKYLCAAAVPMWNLAEAKTNALPPSLSRSLSLSLDVVYPSVYLCPNGGQTIWPGFRAGTLSSWHGVQAERASTHTSHYRSLKSRFCAQLHFPCGIWPKRKQMPSLPLPLPLPLPLLDSFYLSMLSIPKWGPNQPSGRDSGHTFHLAWCAGRACKHAYKPSPICSKDVKCNDRDSSQKSPSLQRVCRVCTHNWQQG